MMVKQRSQSHQNDNLDDPQINKFADAVCSLNSRILL
jgi:hypothetical protein